jgi:hypothetical protein
MFVNELFESDTAMNTLVIYPGRFQPWHKGHKAVYDYLVKNFGSDNVFVATTNKVDPPRSPFTFSEKVQFMNLTGISADSIVETRDPYKALEVVQNYDPNTTRLIFAVSEKDMSEDPRFGFKTKKDGSPSYFQPMPKDASDMVPLKQHGYIMTVPTFNFTLLGQPMRSATEVRAQFADADEATQQQIVKDLFGSYDKNVHDIMRLGLGATALNELKFPGSDDGERHEDNYPCYDCGSTILGHHTRLCDLAEDWAIRDLPSLLNSQYWTGKIPKGLAPIAGLEDKGPTNEATDPNFVGFMNKSMTTRQDEKPYAYDPNTIMSMSNMPGYKKAFKFGMDVIKKMDPDTKQEFANAPDDTLFSYMMDLAEKKGFIPKYFVYEDLDEVTGEFEEIFHDPDMEGWTWTDLLRDMIGMEPRALSKANVQAYKKEMAHAQQMAAKGPGPIDPSKLNVVTRSDTKQIEIWYPVNTYYEAGGWVVVATGFQNKQQAEQKLAQMQQDPSVNKTIQAALNKNKNKNESIGDKRTDPAPSKEFVSNKFYVKFTPTGIEFYRRGELVHTKSGDYSNPTRGDCSVAKSITSRLWEKEYQQGINEFAPSAPGGADRGGGNYFKSLAQAWYYNGVHDGDLQGGVKTQQDVERLLQRGIVCPDGVTRKFGIDYNSKDNGVVISSDDWYEHSDHGKRPGTMIDVRTGRPWGPYDYMEFSEDDLDESLNEFAPIKPPTAGAFGGNKDYGQPTSSRYLGNNKFVVGTTNNYVLTATVDKWGLEWDDDDNIWYLDSPGAVYIADATEGEIELPAPQEQRNQIHDLVSDYLNARNSAELQRVAAYYGHSADGEMATNEGNLNEFVPPDGNGGSEDERSRRLRKLLEIAIQVAKEKNVDELGMIHAMNMIAGDEFFTVAVEGLLPDITDREYMYVLESAYKTIKQGLAESLLDEFYPGEGGFGPFKVYISNEFIEEFPTFDQAKEEIDFLRTSDPKSFDADWKIIDGTGKTVWQHDPGEAIDAMRMRRKIQFNKPDDKGIAEGMAQDEAEETNGWRAELVNQIKYNTFEVKMTNTRSKESANFIVRPVDMISIGPTLQIETMDVHDLQTGRTESWTSDDPQPDGGIVYAIAMMFWDNKELQKKLWTIVDQSKDQDLMPGLDQRRSIGQEVDADAYIDSQEKTQAAMAKMKKGLAERMLDEFAAGVGVVASKKQKNDPRYKTSLTVDVHPDTPKKNMRALRLI